MEQSTSRAGVLPRDNRDFSVPGTWKGWHISIIQDAPPQVRSNSCIPVYPAFDPLLSVLSRRFCLLCLALYPLPSFSLMRNTFNKLAIAMVIGTAVTLVRAETHIITAYNL